MGVERFRRPVVAPSFAPEVNGIPLNDLENGTDGQLLIAQTGGATAYKNVSGDVTISKTGATTLGAGKVKKSHIASFAANGQTGTGAAQNVSHGLGVTPSVVFCIPTDGGTVVYGVHTSTNVVVTVTNNKKFDVLAIA